MPRRFEKPRLVSLGLFLLHQCCRIPGKEVSSRADPWSQPGFFLRSLVCDMTSYFICQFFFYLLIFMYLKNNEPARVCEEKILHPPTGSLSKNACRTQDGAVVRPQKWTPVWVSVLARRDPLSPDSQCPHEQEARIISDPCTQGS